MRSRLLDGSVVALQEPGTLPLTGSGAERAEGTPAVELAEVMGSNDVGVLVCDFAGWLA